MADYDISPPPGLLHPGGYYETPIIFGNFTPAGNYGGSGYSSLGGSYGGYGSLGAGGSGSISQPYIKGGLPFGLGGSVFGLRGNGVGLVPGVGESALTGIGGSVGGFRGTGIGYLRGFGGTDFAGMGGNYYNRFPAGGMGGNYYSSYPTGGMGASGYNLYPMRGMGASGFNRFPPGGMGAGGGGTGVMTGRMGTAALNARANRRRQQNREFMQGGLQSVPIGDTAENAENKDAKWVLDTLIDPRRSERDLDLYHGLKGDQPQQVAVIAGEAAKTTPGFFAGMVDFFLGLVDLVAGTTFKATRQAKRKAEQAADWLEKAGYAPEIVSHVSGVQRGSDGSYIPVRGKYGEDIGLLAREQRKTSNPAQVAHDDAVDAGQVPGHLGAVNAVIDEELKYLYARPEVYAQVIKSRATPARDEAAEFIDANQIEIMAIADRSIAYMQKVQRDDPSSDHYNYPAHRADIVRMIQEKILKDHKSYMAKAAVDRTRSVASSSLASPAASSAPSVAAVPPSGHGKIIALKHLHHVEQISPSDLSARMAGLHAIDFPDDHLLVPHYWEKAALGLGVNQGESSRFSIMAGTNYSDPNFQALPVEKQAATLKAIVADARNRFVNKDKLNALIDAMAPVTKDGLATPEPGRTAGPPSPRASASGANTMDINVVQWGAKVVEITVQGMKDGNFYARDIVTHKQGNDLVIDGYRLTTGSIIHVKTSDFPKVIKDALNPDGKFKATKAQLWAVVNAIEKEQKTLTGSGTPSVTADPRSFDLPSPTTPPPARPAPGGPVPAASPPPSR